MDIQLTANDLVVLNSDYLAGEVSREEAQQFIQVHRGSVRLACDRYRTESEYRDFINQGLRIKLPGQSGFIAKRRDSFFVLLKKAFANR